ncbi:unnamed protein product, partial [Linum tenue]
PTIGPSTRGERRTLHPENRRETGRPPRHPSWRRRRRSRLEKKDGESGEDGKEKEKRKIRKRGKEGNSSMTIMPPPILQGCGGVIAYTVRSSGSILLPSPHLNSLFLTIHHRHLRAPASSSVTAARAPPCSSRCPTLRSFHFPQNVSLFLTGNSSFLKMEGIMCQAWWSCCILLAIVYGSCLLAKGAQFCAISRDLELKPQNWPKPIPHMERFWSGNSIDKNKAMVDNLKRYGVFNSDKVAEVMENIDRALFVPNGNSAYADTPMPIGYNATISAPHMHATCLQLLEDYLKPGMHALDVGSGTGYLTACFAMMVGPEGRAIGVDHIPELVETSIKNVEKSAAASLTLCPLLNTDGRQGWPEFAPYDAIHVGAAAPEIPQPLIEQLKPGGRMVIPVGSIFQDLKVVDKNQDGSISVRTETSVRYVPLTSKDAQLRGN